MINPEVDFDFSLWVDPTLRADADADIILEGQSSKNAFGSVASAGDFNSDGIEDIIIGARSDDNTASNSGSAFIFFGSITGTKRAELTSPFSPPQSRPLIMLALQSNPQKLGQYFLVYQGF